MDIVSFLIQCLNSVQYGLLLFLVASGLTLIFGIMGVINLAHGSFYMLGAYLAFTLAGLTGNLFIAIPLGIVLAVAFGYVLEWAFFSYLYERDHLQQVLMTYGLILVFEELRSILVGDDVHGVQVPALLDGALPIGNDMTYPVYRLFISAVCLVVALAVLAGMIAAPVSSVYPGMGAQVLIVCFVVVVIGGIGSVKGALVASLLLGFVDTFGKVFWQEAAGVLIYLLMAVILLWKPQGLFKAG